MQIDATPFRQWWEQHYGKALGKKGLQKSESGDKPAEGALTRKQASRQDDAHVEQALGDQFTTGRVFAVISSRPGQCGRADGYVLEGQELEFYLKRVKSKK